MRRPPRPAEADGSPLPNQPQLQPDAVHCYVNLKVVPADWGATVRNPDPAEAGWRGKTGPENNGPVAAAGPGPAWSGFQNHAMQ